MRALARFKSAKKGRCDAEDAADEIRRENGEKPLNSTLTLHSSFFIFHSSFIIMHRLRILISFWASTLEDEICQIASKDKAISKAKLIPLVFFGVTALRPLRPPRLCVPLASRASRSASLMEIKIQLPTKVFVSGNEMHR